MQTVYRGRFPAPQIGANFGKGKRGAGFRSDCVVKRRPDRTATADSDNDN